MSEHDIPEATKETVEQYLDGHADIHARFRSASSAEFRRVAGRLATILVLNLGASRCAVLRLRILAGAVASGGILAGFPVIETEQENQS